MKAFMWLRFACLLTSCGLATMLFIFDAQVALAGEPVTLPSIGNSGYANPRAGLLPAQNSIPPLSVLPVQTSSSPVPTSARVKTYSYGDDGWMAETGTSSPSPKAVGTAPQMLPAPSSSGLAFLPPGQILPPSVHTPNAAISPTEKLLPIDLPYALHLANAANPTIAMARERIAEAYADLRQSQVLFLPNIFLGGNPHAFAFLPQYFAHSGVVQNANGLVFPTTKSNIFIQGGTTLEVSVADALFAPLIARQGTAAAAARARAVENDIQLDVALAYLDLLLAYGELAINAEALVKAETMLKAAESAFKQGLGKTGADPDRARTEVSVLRQRRLVAQAEAARASANLAQLLMLDPGADLLPADQTVLPIALVPTDCAIDELIATALMNRPELVENRALIAAALGRWNQAKYRPLIPTLQMFYYGGNFIGGKNDPTTAGGRNDFLAQMSWELKNLGLGDLYNARARRSQYNQANFKAMEMQNRIGAEVATATKIVRQRQKAVAEAQIAVRNAEDMWVKLEKIAFGIGLPARQFDPLEPLLAERALMEARMLYLQHVIEYNRNQFRLYWALGQPPMCALPKAQSQPVSVSVLPSANSGSGRSTDGEKGMARDKKAPVLPAPRPVDSR